MWPCYLGGFVRRQDTLALRAPNQRDQRGLGLGAAMAWFALRVKGYSSPPRERTQPTPQLAREAKNPCCSRALLGRTGSERRLAVSNSSNMYGFLVHAIIMDIVERLRA